MSPLVTTWCWKGNIRRKPLVVDRPCPFYEETRVWTQQPRSMWQWRRSSFVSAETRSGQVKGNNIASFQWPITAKGCKICTHRTDFPDVGVSRFRGVIVENPLKLLLQRNFHIFCPSVFLKNVKYRCKLREITMNRIRLNFFCLDITLQKSQKLVHHCFVRNLESAVFDISGLFCDVIQLTTFAWATEIHRVSVDSPCLSLDNESEQSFNLDDMACIRNSEVWHSSHGAGSYPHVNWEWNSFDRIKMHVEVLISSYQNWN